MNIMLNGNDHRLDSRCTITELLERLGQNTSRVVVELNSSLVPRENYHSVSLKDGDVIEIVRLVGGG